MATAGTARSIPLRLTFAGGDLGIVAPEDVPLLFKHSLRELGTDYHVGDIVHAFSRTITFVAFNLFYLL